MGCWGDWDYAHLHWSGRAGSWRASRTFGIYTLLALWRGGHHICRLILGSGLGFGSRLVPDRPPGVLGVV